MPLVVENMPKDGVYLYIISPFGRENEPLRPIKIGITGNMAARLASIQTGSHVKLRATMAINTPQREIARSFEAAFHAFYADHRLEGEWFDVDPIEAMCMFCVAFKDYFIRNCAGDGAEPTVDDLSELIGLPHWEREIKVFRAWREHYAENSNVTSLTKGR
ncbi:GIY-YIG nuclease family protein [Tardiphaga sp. 866_E4_N2_1]|uniref:GIY-YIG nuclease family protein n=1 Tax=unclassified Tardiphaga TaxID=2631404 RepID=UPI003F23E195